MEYFQGMREDLEAGGYSLLLSYLLAYDRTGADVNKAPKTEGLQQQKTSSLPPFQQFWYAMLSEGSLGLDFSDGEWATEVDKKSLRSAFKNYCQEMQIRSRVPNDIWVGRLLRRMCPSLQTNCQRKEDGGFVKEYRLPDLETCRKEWDGFIGHTTEWPYLTLINGGAS